MIPADLAARLRMLTEASFFQTDQPVHELNPTRPIPADLPEFAPGQRFTATIERPLPNGRFSALVAGRAITLALPEGADAGQIAAGQTLALEVTRHSPQAVQARIVAPQVEPQQAASLSRTGRLISILLTGQPATAPVPLAAGQPLLATPPTSGAPLVPVLQQAISQSGLFYESHQAQWLSGQVSTATLLQEPQGQFPAPLPASGAEQTRPPASPLAGRPEGPPAPIPPAPAAEPEDLVRQALQFLGLEARLPGEGEPARPTAAPAMSGAGIPERLLPLVSHQLDALATQQFVWQGQVWPGQAMEWRIEDPSGGHGEGAEGQEWRTTLRLTLPRLGPVEARLHLSGGGVRVQLQAPEPQAQAALSAGRKTLARGLDAARVPLLGLSVGAPP
jgi:hypothetical protein